MSVCLFVKDVGEAESAAAHHLGSDSGMSDFKVVCAQAMQNDGVLGVVCVDANGLVLHSEGAVPEGCGGAIACLASCSLKLVGDEAVVTSESPTGKVLISRSEGAIVGLFMQPKADQ